MQLTRMLFFSQPMIGLSAFAIAAGLGLPPAAAATGSCGDHFRFAKGSAFEIVFPLFGKVEPFEIMVNEKVTFEGIRTPPLTDGKGVVDGNQTMTGKATGQVFLQREPNGGTGRVVYLRGNGARGNGALYQKEIGAGGEWKVSLDPMSEATVELPDGTKIGPVTTDGTNFKVEVLKGETVIVPLGAGGRLPVKLARDDWFRQTVDSTKRAALSAPGQLRVPPGGTLKLIVRKPGFNFANKPFHVCYEAVGKEGQGQPRGTYIPDVIIERPTADQAELTMTLPNRGQDLPGGYWPWSPLELRVFHIDKGTMTLLAEGPIRVSSLGWAFGVAVFAFLAAYFIPALLSLFKSLADKKSPLQGMGPMSLMRGKYGRASLSNFQIWLWTIVVFTTIAYVWMLTGELMKITNGILVLLGISGAANLGAKITAIAKQTRARQALKLPALDAFEPEPNVRPKWADLISVKGEFNLLKFQMFLFTLLAVAFVAFTVFTEFLFPELPGNLLLLMGISNGVYLGGKMASHGVFDRLEAIYLDLEIARENLDNKKAELEKLNKDLGAAIDADEKKKIETDIKRIGDEISALETEIEGLEKKLDSAKAALGKVLPNSAAAVGT